MVAAGEIKLRVVEEYARTNLSIDLGAFKETAFDESAGIVSVTPAVTCGELNAYLSGYDRFVSTSDCPTVGLGGFLLQGGVGMGFSGWGYAAEQIASIDVVTADGELVRADAQSNSNLLTSALPVGLHSSIARVFYFSASGR
jgi:FAD/FMN-containing dehydrogenase